MDVQPVTEPKHQKTGGKKQKKTHTYTVSLQPSVCSNHLLQLAALHTQKRLGEEEEAVKLKGHLRSSMWLQQHSSFL